jgi:hypothetical protein
MPAWPGTLPPPRVEGYTEAPEDTVVRFRPERGAAKQRPGVSKGGRLLSYSLTLTSAQRATLLAFYETDCAGGALDVTLTHWLDGGTVTLQWRSPPSLVTTGAAWRASLSMYQRP